MWTLFEVGNGKSCFPTQLLSRSRSSREGSRSPPTLALACVSSHAPYVVRLLPWLRDTIRKRGITTEAPVRG
ncbi:hypothetical protein K1719_039897 [Acacia pycnantha]|nr:hypothetical protein K1719_039897 [Acacia pycnantha]